MDDRPTSDPPDRARPRNLRLASLAGPILGLLLVLVLGLISFAIWRRSRPSDPYTEAVAPLVEAVGARRFVAGRLTGGFRYGPMVAVRRSAQPTADAPEWKLLAAAARIKAQVDKTPTVESRRALAVAHLMLGEPEPAIRILEGLAQERAQDAAVRSDLAAAYLSRAGDDHEDDYARAFEAAAEALERDGRLGEGWFNKVLAAEALNLGPESEYARRKAAETEGSSEWRGPIEERPERAFEPTSPDRRAMLVAEETELAPMVARAPSEAREAIELELLASDDPSRIARARTLARAYADVTGDGSIVASLRQIAESSPAARVELRRGCRLYAEGRTASDAGDTTRAESLFQEAGRIFSRYRNPYHDWVRFQLAVMAYWQGLRDRALEEVRHIDAGTPSPILSARCRWMEALILAGRGEGDKAIERYQAAESRFRQANDRAGVNCMEYLLADTHRLLGDYVQAWRHLRSALIGMVDLPDRTRRYTLLQVAMTISMENGLLRLATAFERCAQREAALSGSPVAAVESQLYEARTLSPSDPLAAVRMLAGVDRSLDRIPEGAMRQRLSAEVAWTRGLLARALPPGEAIDALDASIRFFSAHRVDARLPLLYGARGRARRAAGDAAGTETDLRAGIAALAAVRDRQQEWPRIGVSDRVWRVVDDLVDLQIESGAAPESALALVESERARTRGVGSPVTAESLRRLASRLEPSRAIVVYYAAGDRVHIWVLRNSGIRVAGAAHLPDQLETKVAEFEAQLVTGRQAPAAAMARTLYDAVLGPVESDLRDVQRVTIVPDGPLARLPFGGLRDPAGALAAEKWVIELAPWVPTSAAHTSRPLAAGPRLLALLGKGGLPLAAARQELDEVAALYPRSARLEGSVGPAAVGQALTEADVVHFAGHAVLNSMRPDLSGLLLAAAPQPRSAGLYVADIERLDLRRVRLISLGACEGAAAAPRRSVGPISLASAFLRAGADSVVAPLGLLDDAFARSTFVDFHRRYRQLGDPALALHQLQTELLRQGREAEASQSLDIVVMKL